MIDYKEAHKIAAEFDSHLTAYDFKNGHFVLVEHDDGSRFLFAHAFMIYHANWVFIYSEHHGFQIYDIDDVVAKELKEHQ